MKNLLILMVAVVGAQACTAPRTPSGRAWGKLVGEYEGCGLDACEWLVIYEGGECKTWAKGKFGRIPVFSGRWVRSTGDCAHVVLSESMGVQPPIPEFEVCMTEGGIETLSPRPNKSPVRRAFTKTHGLQVPSYDDH